MLRRVRTWVKRVRRRAIRRGAKLVTSLLLTFPAIAVGVAWSSDLFGVLAQAVAATALGVLVAVVSWLFAGSVRREAEVELGSESVRIGDESFGPDDVEGGFLTASLQHDPRTATPVRDAWEARIQLRDGRELRVAFDEHDDAMALLCALGADGSRRRLVLPRRKSGTVITTLLLTLITFPVFVGVWMGAGITLPKFAGAVSMFAPLVWLYPRFFTWVLMRLQPSDVVVGRDGTRTSKGFVAHHHVRGVDIEGDEVVLTTPDGPVRIDMGPVSPALRVALQERIEAMMAEARPPVTTLGRGVLDFEAWVKRMKGLAASDYRDAGLPPESLHEVLEDATASPEQRVGAAVALLARERERPKVRVRIAELADSVADEDLERAFEELADGRLRKKTAEALRS